MRFITVVALLNACLLAALPGLPIPRLPDAPDVPRLPDTPNAPDTPSHPGNEPGRWPPENHNPNDPAPADPGRLPAQPQQRPHLPACGGKKRMDCDTEWNQLDIPTKFRDPGRLVIERLDSVRANPPQPPNAPTLQTMTARYQGFGRPAQNPDIPFVVRQRKNVEDERNWFEFKVRNKDEVIERFVRREKETALTPERNARLDNLARRLREDEYMLEHWTSWDGRTLVFEKFFNEKYDLYRDYNKDPLGEPEYVRTGLDKAAVIRFTDQAMFGWRQAIGTRNPKDVKLENIVHKEIITEETNQVIEAVIAKAGKRLNTAEDIIDFKKGEEGFDAIMGTIHGRRMAEMLTDYHDVVGDRTISRISITLSDNADGFSKPQTHDMLIHVENMM